MYTTFTSIYIKKTWIAWFIKQQNNSFWTKFLQKEFVLGIEERRNSVGWNECVCSATKLHEGEIVVTDSCNIYLFIFVKDILILILKYRYTHVDTIYKKNTINYLNLSYTSYTLILLYYRIPTDLSRNFIRLYTFPHIK